MDYVGILRHADLVSIGLFFVWWMIYYYFEGTHDGYLCLQINNSTPFDTEFDVKYSLGWHTWDTFEKIMTHLTVPVLFSHDLLGYLLMVNFSLGIRIFFHDYFIQAKRFGWVKGWNIYPTYDYKGDWWDGFLVYIRGKGITQNALKHTYLGLSLISVVIYAKS